MRNIQVSFLGLGVVGSQLMEYLRGNLDHIYKEYDCKIVINKVFVRDRTKQRSIDISGLSLTDNPYETLEEADIVVECLGGNGLELTRELVLASIRSKKAVIMSSKKCLARYGKEIAEEARRCHTALYYDATVGGGIPISTIFENMGKCERIEKIYGICNATSNYILTERKNTNFSYEEALQKAKNNGYAENDPSEDVDGYDALYKSVIMMGFGMRKWLDCNLFTPVSITTLSEQDFIRACQNQCVIKPIFCIEQKKGNISCTVGPQLVVADSLLAAVNGNNNVIVVCGSESGERAFYGQGAGSKPTASAMYDDLMKAVGSNIPHLH